MATWTLPNTPWDTKIINNARSCWSTSQGKFIITNGDSATHVNDNEIYSSDGVNWTGLGLSVGFEGAYGIVNVRDSVPIFVTGAGSAGNIGVYTSANGTSWTFRTSPINGKTATAIAYSSDLNLWVAGTGSLVPGPKLITAVDPTSTWTLRTNAWGASANSSCWGAAWGPSPASIFVVCGASNVGSAPDTDGVQTSPDGINWTSRSAGNNGMNGGFAYQVIWSTLLGKFVLVGGNRTNTKSIAHSSDGINWTDVPTAPFNGGECLCVIEANGRLYFGGYDTSSPAKTCWSTTDLSTFTDEGCPIDGQVDTLSFSPSLGLLMAAGNEFFTTSRSVATAPLSSSTIPSLSTTFDLSPS